MADFMNDEKALLAAFEWLLVIMVIALLLWQFYDFCFHGRRSRRPRRDSRSRSFTTELVLHHPPAQSPLDPLLFELLPTSTYSSTPAEADEHSQRPPECAICLDEFKEGDIGRVLPNCDHFFHLRCIDDWLRTNKTCPLCREVVKPPRIPSQHENTDGEEGQLENSSNVNLPPPIWCPRSTARQVIESEQVVIEIPQDDHRRSQMQST